LYKLLQEKIYNKKETNIDKLYKAIKLIWQ